MDSNPKPLSARWRWFKLAAGAFLPPPAFFALIASWLLWSRGADDTKVAGILQLWLAVGLLAVFLLAYAQPLGLRAGESRLVGIGVGILMLLVLIAGYVLLNMFTAAGGTVSSTLLVPAFWLAFFGWPFAAAAGWVFSGCSMAELRKSAEASNPTESSSHGVSR
jgi:prepilin signal peptidase PulO-like enzyme (type II secretory pathway)